MDWRNSPIRFLVIRLTLSVIGLFFFALQEVYAYPTPVDFTGQLSRWDRDLANPEVYIRIKDSDGLNREVVYQEYIEAAAALWTGVAGSFVELELTNAVDEDILIILEDASKHSAASAGYAMFDQVDDDGKPIHCEIHVALGVSEIRKTFLHEIGHCLGLGHSLVPESIMSYRNDKNSFDLDVDDEAVISRLYPADGSGAMLPQGCAVGAHSPSPLTWSLFFGLFACLGLDFLRVSMKRKKSPYTM